MLCPRKHSEKRDSNCKWIKFQLYNIMKPNQRWTARTFACRPYSRWLTALGKTLKCTKRCTLYYLCFPIFCFFFFFQKQFIAVMFWHLKPNKSNAEYGRAFLFGWLVVVFCGGRFGRNLRHPNAGQFQYTVHAHKSVSQSHAAAAAAASTMRMHICIPFRPVRKLTRAPNGSSKTHTTRKSRAELVVRALCASDLNGHSVRASEGFLFVFCCVPPPAKYRHSRQRRSSKICYK